MYAACSVSAPLQSVFRTSYNPAMPIVRIPQVTETDCLPCCIAMVLDQTRETVLSWFEGREYEDPSVMRDVLSMHGYTVDEVALPGHAGGVRRILGLVNRNGEGHAVAMDEDESIVDPRSKATTKRFLLDYSATGYAVGRVFIITKKEE
jgi:hypothetical protein